MERDRAYHYGHSFLLQLVSMRYLNGLHSRQKHLFVDWHRSAPDLATKPGYNHSNDATVGIGRVTDPDPDPDSNPTVGGIFRILRF